MKLEHNLYEKDILKGIHDDKFREYKIRDIHLDKKSYKDGETYYLKLFVKNNTKKSTLELYGLFRHDGKVICFTDEGNVKENFKSEILDDIKLFYRYASINIKPGETKKIYIKIQNFNIPARTSIYISELNKILKSENNYSKVDTLLIGLTFIVSILSLIIYFKIKKRYLLFYSLLCLSNYFKSFLFIQYLREMDFQYTRELYCALYIIYIVSLIEFMKSILKLEGWYERFIPTFNNIKYFNIALALILLFEIGDSKTIVFIRMGLQIFLFAILVYLSYFKYKEGNKVYFYSFLPKLIYHSIHILPCVDILLFTYEGKILEQFEFLANIVLIGGVLLYEVMELVRVKTKLDESETVVATINNSDNLMHSLENIVKLYKNDIRHSSVFPQNRSLQRRYYI